MKQKLFTLFALLVAIVTGANAQITTKTWDFTAITAADIEALSGNEAFTDETANKQIKNAGEWAKGEITHALEGSDGTDISVADGLLFGRVTGGKIAAGAFIYYYGDDKKIYFNNSNCAVKLPSIKGGQIVKITTTSYSGEVTLTNGSGASVSAGVITFAVTANGAVQVQFNSKVENLKSIVVSDPVIPGAVTFSPASGSSVNAGSSITLSAEDATSYKYKWTSSTTTPIDGWSTGSTATVPEYGSENVYLHAYGVSSAGDGAASYAQYTITQPKVATPTFSPKSKGFTAASLSVTIACATADATIQYSYDNSTWHGDSSAISVTATTTIYAKATKSGYIDSDVSSEKYTKQDAGSSGSVSDLVAVSSGYTFISETIVPAAGYLYLENKIYTTKKNTVKADKGSSTINGESYSNCLRLRKGEDVVFKTDGACLLTLYCSTVNNNAVAAGSSVGGDEYGSYTTATTGGTRVFVIPAAGTVYVTGTGDGSDWCIAGFTLTDIPTATITTNKGKWASFTPSWNATLSTGATAYIITDVTGENITATSVSVLGANKGYFVKGTAALTPYTATPIGSDADATTGNKIVACTSATDLNATTPNNHDKYVLGTTSTGESGLFLVDSDVTVGAGKAYLDADGTGGAHVLSLNFDESGDVTGISNVNNEVKSLFDGDFYNLKGQRVALPTKGLYIINGRKVVIK